MAKDPAFLFYPGDWLGGTMGMTLEEKGAYLELLVMQWNSGRITDTAAKRLVGAELWHKLAHKFSADGNGLFNKRLEHEKQKRKKHSENQSNNAKKRWNRDSSGNATALPLENANENINETENEVKDRGTGKGDWNTKPSSAEMNLELDPVKGGAVVELFAISKNHTLTASELSGLWSVFKKQNFTGQKFYQSKHDVYSHFINWSKTQKINGTATHRQSSSGSNGRVTKSDGAIKLIDSLKEDIRLDTGREQGD